MTSPQIPLPAFYPGLTPQQRRRAREQYIALQNGACWYCHEPLDANPPTEVTGKPINWALFPPHFLAHPIHLQHDHDTGLTEGAVHAYCNAVLWQYHGR
jgi:hypothetical protein